MPKPAETCPYCAKRCKGRQGLEDHLKAAHPDAMVELGLHVIAEEVATELRMGVANNNAPAALERIRTRMRHAMEDNAHG